MAKITTKQAYALFMLAAFSPMIRLVPGTRAGWVSLFVSCALFYGLVILLNVYFKNKDNADLFTLYKSAFGKVIARLLVFAYIIWIALLGGHYLGAFTDKFAGLVMPGVPAGFFAITLLALVFIILSGKFQSFALLSNIFFYIVLLAIAMVFLLQLPRIRPANLLPVTQYDIPDIMSGVLPSLGIFVYITPLLFLGGECTEERAKFRRYGLYSAGALLGAGLAIFAATVGVFGKDLVGEMTQPFLMSVKTVGAQGALERLESIFLLLWVVTDLAILVMLLHILLKLLGLTANVQSTAVFKSPLILGVYLLSLFTGIPALSEAPGLKVSLIMGLAVPSVAVGVYKLKKKLKKS
jgi:hypothetical protein